MTGRASAQCPCEPWECPAVSWPVRIEVEEVAEALAGDFPRITEADLRPGVGDCRYSISTAGLERYLLATEDIAEAISGKGPDE